LDLADVKNNFINSRNNFHIYQGFFYLNNFMKKIHLILPVTLYMEDVSFYLNLEGRLRQCSKVLNESKNQIRDSKAINFLQLYLLNLNKTHCINNYNFSI
jgi:NADH dehydrogenase/NADH:ubiquinone oxidoreductase subunit G